RSPTATGRDLSTSQAASRGTGTPGALAGRPSFDGCDLSPGTLLSTAGAARRGGAAPRTTGGGTSGRQCGAGGARPDGPGGRSACGAGRLVAACRHRVSGRPRRELRPRPVSPAARQAKRGRALFPTLRGDLL